MSLSSSPSSPGDDGGPAGGPDPHPQPAATTQATGPETPTPTATVAGGTNIDEPYFAPNVGVVPIHRPAGEDYDAPHSLASTLSSLRQMVSSFDAVAESLLSSIDVQCKRLDHLERRCGDCRARLEALKKLKERGEAATVRAPSSHSSFSAEAGGEGRGGGGVELEDDSSSSVSALSRARIASNRAVYGQIVRDVGRDDGMAVPSDSWLDRAADDDGSDGFGDDGGFDELGGCRRAVDRFRSVPSLSHGTRLDAEEAAVEDEMARVMSKTDWTVEGKGAVTHEDLRRLKLGAVNEAMRRLRAASLDDEVEDGGGAATTRHRPPRSVGAGSASAGASAAAADDDVDDTVSILTLDSSFPRATTAAHARQQQQRRQRRPRTSRHPTHPAATSAARADAAHPPAAATAQRHQAASGSLPYLCELLHDARGVGDSIPEETSSTRDLFAFRGGAPLYGLGGGATDDHGLGRGGRAGAGAGAGPAPVEGAAASTSASAASPRSCGGTRAGAAATATACSSASFSSLSPLRLLEDGGGRRAATRASDQRATSVSASPPPSPGRAAPATSSASASSVASGGGGARSSDVIAAPTAAAITTGGGGISGDDGGLAYRPKSLPHDAGRFDMPTNLPLSDVAYIPSSRGGGVDAGSTSSRKDVPNGEEGGGVGGRGV